jgi:hypothetical protein
MMFRARKGFACACLLSMAAARADVVINEIHYDPEDKTVPLEFVELHNTAATNVNLSSWRLASGIEFTFPAGTEILANGFLVIAENPAAIQTVFNIPALGPFVGSLSNEGDRIVLRDAAGAQIDEVTYGIGFPWPTASRGAGASMELIHPALDNDLGGSWRASRPPFTVPEQRIYLPASATNWRYRKGTSEPAGAPGAWRTLDYIEDETWLTGQTSIGYGDGDDNTVLGDMLNNYTTIYLRKTIAFAAGEVPPVLQLNVNIDDGFVAWINGVEVARYNVSDPSPAFNSTASGAFEPEWQRFVLTDTSMLRVGDNILAIHALNQSLGSSDVTIDAELRTPDQTALDGQPTPGRVNSALLASRDAAPPQLRQVNHTPKQPTNAQPVTITVKATDTNSVAAVTLNYQLNVPGQYIRKTDPAYNNSWVSATMRDDGTNGDLVAGDSIFSAIIPANLNVHRTLIRYRISANDSLGNSVRAPYADDESPNFAYFVYNGAPAWRGASRPGATPVQEFPASLMNSLPTYHLLANQTDVSNSQWNGSYDTVRMWGTLVYDGEVYDHIQFHNRGEGSTYNTGKNKWRFHFNRARDFQPRDNYGRRYKSTWKVMNFDACASPWAAVNRGMAGLDESISYRLYELAGVPGSKTHYLQFRIIDNATEASATSQYEGDLWGLYMAIEQPDGRFLDERDLPDGNVYKIEGGGDKKNQGPTQPTTTSDWNAFASASRTTQTESWWRTNMNMPVFYSFHAMNRLTGNVDLRHNYNHYFYHHTDGRWMVMPWDMDMMFIAETHWPGVIDQNNSLNVPNLRTEFRNRCREILDLMCSDPFEDGGQIGQLIEEYAHIVNPPNLPLTWADVDEAMWNWHPQARGNNQPGGQTDHKGNFYRTPFTDSRMGGNWVRALATPNHEGFVKFIRDYMTDTDPDGFAPGDGDQRGYGYNFLELEATDAAIPDQPTMTYTGAPNFPVNALSFSTSDFSDPQGANTFGAIQWRLAEIYHPGLSNYVAGEPRKYEIETLWDSGELTTFTNEVSIPLAVARPGATYRARVKMKDNTGRWSHWSPPLQFIASGPDLSSYSNAVMITEIMYAPTSPTPAEAAAGYVTSDFEFIELKNITDSPLDLTGLRFTKGVDFDFPTGAILPAHSYGLVVRNTNAFASRYGTNLLVFGSFAPDQLANEGEQIKLSYGAGIGIHDFDYGVTSPWPANLAGRSIMLIDPESKPNHNTAANWRASASVGGNPGAGQTGPQSFAAWKQFYGITSDTDDSDGDGLNAFIEYATGSDPRVASRDRLPSHHYNRERQELILSAYLNSFSDVTLTLESSADLTNWQTTTNTSGTGVIKDGYSINYHAIPIEPDQEKFYRVLYHPN